MRRMSDRQRSGDPETIDGPLGGRQRARLAAAISEAIAGWLAANPWFPAPGAQGVASLVRAFLRTYDDRPIIDNAGGSRFNSSAWLYVLTRLLAPRLVVESGTHRGHSAWLFSRAAPSARVLTFDISHEALSDRIPGIDYRLADWSTSDVRVRDPGHDFAFFDDHVDQARRVREAWERGFRWLIFDDNLSAQALFATGRPPATTVSMIYDPTLRDGETLTWTRHGRPRTFRFDKAGADAAQRLIAEWSILPDLRPVTGFRPQLGLTVVRLTDGR